MHHPGKEPQNTINWLINTQTTSENTQENKNILIKTEYKLPAEQNYLNTNIEKSEQTTCVLMDSKERSTFQIREVAWRSSCWQTDAQWIRILNYKNTESVLKKNIRTSILTCCQPPAPRTRVALAIRRLAQARNASAACGDDRKKRIAICI